MPRMPRKSLESLGKPHFFLRGMAGHTGHKYDFFKKLPCRRLSQAGLPEKFAAYLHHCCCKHPTSLTFSDKSTAAQIQQPFRKYLKI